LTGDWVHQFQVVLHRVTVSSSTTHDTDPKRGNLVLSLIVRLDKLLEDVAHDVGVLCGLGQ
jgi:hypothetical protein